jgi:hypothetical protein
VANTAVSSLNFAVVDSVEVGRSAVYRRYNTDPRTLLWSTPLWLRRILCTQIQLSCESVCSADRIWVKWNNSEGETVLTCTGICCRTILLVFKGFVYPLYNSMCLFYCGMPLFEAKMMIWCKSIILTTLRGVFHRHLIQWVGGLLAGRMLTQ